MQSASGASCRVLPKSPTAGPDSDISERPQDRGGDPTTSQRRSDDFAARAAGWVSTRRCNCFKRFSTTAFSALSAAASLMAISSWSAHNSSVDIDLKSFRFTTVPNHDSIFELSSSAENLSTRPIQNAPPHQVRSSRGCTKEICVVQRKLDGIKPTNFPNSDSTIRT